MNYKFKKAFHHYKNEASIRWKKANMSLGRFTQSCKALSFQNAFHRPTSSVALRHPVYPLRGWRRIGLDHVSEVTGPSRVSEARPSGGNMDDAHHVIPVVTCRQVCELICRTGLGISDTYPDPPHTRLLLTCIAPSPSHERDSISE